MGMEKCEFALPRGALVRFFDETGDKEITTGLSIGPEDNSALIIVPLADESMLEATVGDRLRVRYEYVDAMAEFRSVLTEIMNNPVLLWRIRVPEEVNRFELRDHKRTQCSVSATIEITPKGISTGTIIRDISKSGARCVIRQREHDLAPLAVGDIITLRCTFPGIAGEQTASGSITQVDQTPEEMTIGIHFTENQVWVPPYH